MVCSRTARRPNKTDRALYLVWAVMPVRAYGPIFSTQGKVRGVVRYVDGLGGLATSK